MTLVLVTKHAAQLMTELTRDIWEQHYNQIREKQQTRQSFPRQRFT